MSDLVLWTLRMGEVGSYHATELVWDEVWALIAYGYRRESPEWTQQVLWDLRLWSWVASLEGDHGTCQCCGARIDKPLLRRTHCSSACRKVACRCRAHDPPESTPFGAVVEEAKRHLRRIRHLVTEAQRWLRRAEKLHQTFLTIPPDWSRIDHLPMLPRPCGKCDHSAEHRCRHTGGICLYAQTGVLFDEEPSGDERPEDP